MFRSRKPIGMALAMVVALLAMTQFVGARTYDFEILGWKNDKQSSRQNANAGQHKIEMRKCSPGYYTTNPPSYKFELRLHRSFQPDLSFGREGYNCNDNNQTGKWSSNQRGQHFFQLKEAPSYASLTGRGTWTIP